MPEPVVGLYIFDSHGRILLIRTPKLDNKWMVPGGHIERGEYISDAARREALEETGIRVKPLGVFAVAESPSATAGRFARRHFIYFETVCKALGTKVKLDGKEAVAYDWFAAKDAVKLVKFPLVRRIISDCSRQMASGKIKYVGILRQKNAGL
jgi:nucleoside triphosphatase